MARGLSFRRQRRSVNTSRLKYILVWAIEIIAVVLLAFLIVTGFGFRTQMIGDAMSPTLSNTNVVLIDRVSYKVKSPSRGDVIAFRPDSNAKSHYYIRRIIGVPGDKVQIIDGELYVNDEITTLPGLTGQITVAGNAKDEIVLEDGEYFVMGDNPNSSEDSRHASIGIVNSSDIAGRVWMAVSIGSNFGLVN